MNPEHDARDPSSRPTSAADAADPADGAHAVSAANAGNPANAAAKAEAIIAGLGGAANILEIEPCITRLRTEVRDGALVNEAVLKSAGVHGVSRRGSIVQVIVGPEADVLAQDIEDQLDADPRDEDRRQ